MLYRLNNRLKIGKYAGAVVEVVATQDPQYIEWANENDVMLFHSQVLEFIERMPTR